MLFCSWLIVFCYFSRLNETANQSETFFMAVQNETFRPPAAEDKQDDPLNVDATVSTFHPETSSTPAKSNTKKEFIERGTLHRSCKKDVCYKI